MSISNRRQVAMFLTEMKKALQEHSFHLQDRSKNLKTMAALGYTISDIKNTLLNLTVQDYVKGPEPDRDPNYSGDFWFFGVETQKINLYIKLKLIDSHEKRVLCLSFHEEEWPQKYPFKK